MLSCKPPGLSRRCHGPCACSPTRRKIARAAAPSRPARSLRGAAPARRDDAGRRPRLRAPPRHRGVIGLYSAFRDEIHPGELIERARRCWPAPRSALQPAMADPLVFRAWAPGDGWSRPVRHMPEPSPDAPEVMPARPDRAARRLRPARLPHRLWRRLLRPRHPGPAPSAPGLDARPRLRLPGGRARSRRAARRARSMSIATEPELIVRALMRGRLMRLLFLGDIVGRTGRNAVIEQPARPARALAARCRRHQRRERRRRLRHHRGDLRRDAAAPAPTR